MTVKNVLDSLFDRFQWYSHPRHYHQDSLIRVGWFGFVIGTVVAALEPRIWMLAVGVTALGVVAFIGLLGRRAWQVLSERRGPTAPGRNRDGGT